MTKEQIRKENRVGALIIDKCCFIDDTALFMRVIAVVDIIKVKSMKEVIIYICYHETFNKLKYINNLPFYGVYSMNNIDFSFSEGDPLHRKTYLKEARKLLKNLTL